MLCHAIPSPASLSVPDSPEPKNTKPSDHNSAGKGSLALLVYGSEGGEDILVIHARLAEFGEGMGVYVKPRERPRSEKDVLRTNSQTPLVRNPQKLRVGIRVDVPAGLDVEELAELLDVDEVSVNAHADAERSVHFEGVSWISKWADGEEAGVVRRDAVP